MIKKKITVFSTGGTIEKSYSEEEGSVFNRESKLQSKLVSKLRTPGNDLEVFELMRKDSLDMTDDDRMFISDQIIAASEKGQPIVVLHGTDTMKETLDVVREHSPHPIVPVVFTGAMRPAGFDESDALQNFTEALYAARNLGPGLYLSFHGVLYRGGYAQKNREIMTFEPMSPEALPFG